jgi:NADH-quinone oxidoreductase subunit K
MKNKMNNILNQIGIENYIFLSVILFCIGVFGVLYRRNAIIVFMSIEIMLNAVNFCSVFDLSSRCARTSFVFFSMAVAAAEVAVGLAILVSIFRNLGSITIDNLNLKG